MKRTILCAAAFALAAAALFPFETSGSLTLSGSTTPGVQLSSLNSVRFPFLQGEGPLFSANNLRLSLVCNLTPVGLSAGINAVLTPVAVLELNGGVQAGSGWKLSDDFVGLRLQDGGRLRADTLGGVVVEARGGAALQFDTRAVFPGEWTSVLMRTHNEIVYQHYSNAGQDVGWEFKLDGLRVNGFFYRGSHFIGYSMPLFVDMVGILTETAVYDLYGDPSDLFLTFGLLLNASLGQGFSLTLLPQLTNREIDRETRVMSLGDLGFHRLAFQAVWRY